MFSMKKFGCKPLAPLTTTLTKIDIHGKNANTAAAHIATPTIASFRTLGMSRLVRTNVAPKNTTKKVNPKPSIPARPVSRTMANAAIATTAIEKAPAN
jgi:hypothetical protein